MTTETNAERLERVITYQKHGSPMENADFEWVVEQVKRAQEMEQQNSQLCVDIVFTQIANEGLKNLNKRMEKEIIRLREAINRSLKAHRWNNEESARILEEALAGETNGQRKA